ncbi:TetR/AcrR family transcriptional regulator [Actinocorallia sp. A-T 12471]|uniref:TetR/AcrR family transcriptional regulator n=1 Tax=Actinocorallia sp. A-T 12471 TaxID=3089813 RepID=UPI0029CF12AD|nr:TetR/AcrR family transcriptional regulator [Actinocorallia sp. A-T 12471]MDX6741496.1 TetR/AcrR family transcriptional regulator [Actinocorallia sp. A-T 12471]
MVDGDDAAAATGTWRERSVERSLREARAKAETRSRLLMRTATELLSETGRADFTAQELVERAKTSLRALYQHFGSKDELLLALFEEIIMESTAAWRTEIEQIEDDRARLKFLLEKIYGKPGEDIGTGINRALVIYNLQLAETRPADFARVLAPLQRLIRDLVVRGVANGVYRADLDPEILAIITLQTVMGAASMHALGAELAGGVLNSEHLLEFCVDGLAGTLAGPGR